MSEDSTLAEQLQLILHVKSTLYAVLEHRMNNSLGPLVARLKTVLYVIDGLNLPQETIRKLQTQIGAAIDDASRSSNFIHMHYGLDQVFAFPHPETKVRAFIGDLLAEDIKMLTPYAYDQGCKIRYLNALEQHSSKIYDARLNMTILSILLSIIFSTRGYGGEILVSIQDLDMLRVDFERSLYESISLRINGATEELPSGKREDDIWSLSLMLVKNIGCSISLTQEDENSTIIMQIPTWGD